MSKFRKIREHSGPKESGDPFSIELRRITNLINRRRYEESLSALDELARVHTADPARQSQIASLAADSQFALARYSESVVLYGRALDYLADEKRIGVWIRPALGEAILGLATDKGDLGVIVSVTGSTSIKATGTITGENRSIYAQGNGEAGKLKVEGSLKARFGPLGEWRLGSVDSVVFEGDTGETEKTVLYSF